MTSFVNPSLFFDLTMCMKLLRIFKIPAIKDMDIFFPLSTNMTCGRWWPACLKSCRSSYDSGEAYSSFSEAVSSDSLLDCSSSLLTVKLRRCLALRQLSCSLLMLAQVQRSTSSSLQLLGLQTSPQQTRRWMKTLLSDSGIGLWPPSSVTLRGDYTLWTIWKDVLRAVRVKCGHTMKRPLTIVYNTTVVITQWGNWDQSHVWIKVEPRTLWFRNYARRLL